MKPGKFHQATPAALFGLHHLDNMVPYVQSYSFIFAVMDGQAEPVVIFGLHHLDNMVPYFQSCSFISPVMDGRRGRCRHGRPGWPRATAIFGLRCLDNIGVRFPT